MKCKQLFKIIQLILVFSFVIQSFSSCKESLDADSIMREFSSAYGACGTIYSKKVPRGDMGYIDEDFFFTMYDEGEESVMDYAVLLISHSDRVGECAVFICYSLYDAILVSDMCNRRISTLHSLIGSVDTSCLDGAFIERRGRVVIMCALSDNQRAGEIFARII